MIWIGERCPSTWSAPAWLSSSTTKIAESFQYLLCEMVSTILPTARSPSATPATGFVGPPVWSLEYQIMLKLAGPFLSSSCFHIWYRDRRWRVRRPQDPRARGTPGRRPVPDGCDPAHAV